MLAETATRETFANLADMGDRVLVLPDLRLDRRPLLRHLAAGPEVPPQAAGPAELDRPAAAARAGRANRPHAFVDPPPRPAVGSRPPACLLRLPRPLRRDSDPRRAGRSRSSRLGFVFFEGWFYKAYSLFLDVFGAGLIVGLGIMAVKRGILRPFRLDYWRPDRDEGEYSRRTYVIGDWLFLGTLFFLALTGFLLEAFRIAEENPAFEEWSPIGWIVGQGVHRHRLRGGGRQDGAPSRLVGPRRGGARLRRLDPVHEGGAHAGRARRRGRPGRGGPAAASPRSRPMPSLTRSATSGSPTSHRSTCSTSTPARSAASATLPAPRPRRATRFRRGT